MHEEFQARTEVEVSTERSFGVVFAVVFALLGVLLWWNGSRWYPALLAGGGVFLVLGLTAPQLLAPLNKLWFRFGMLLGKVINPIVLGILFFGTILPTGLLMRLFGKDPLKLKLDAKADSYWVPRDPPGPAAESLKNQF